MTSRTSSRSRRWARWSSSRTACRRRRTTASSGSRDSRGRTTTRLWQRSSHAGSPGMRDPTDAEYDESFSATPNLVLVDGGKGQLSAVIAAMQAFDLPRTAVVSLAKRDEEVFVPDRPDSIRLDRHSAGLQLLQRVRDEAHRFALGFHRQRRDAKARESIFDTLVGVGPCAASSPTEALRLRGTVPGGQPGRARGGARHPGQGGARDLRPAAQSRARLGASRRRFRPRRSRRLLRRNPLRRSRRRLRRNPRRRNLLHPSRRRCPETSRARPRSLRRWRTRAVFR